MSAETKERASEGNAATSAGDEDDRRYLRAHEAYLRLLREGRLHCTENCPLWAIGRCSSRCW